PDNQTTTFNSCLQLTVPPGLVCSRAEYRRGDRGYSSLLGHGARILHRVGGLVRGVIWAWEGQVTGLRSFLSDDIPPRGHMLVVGKNQSFCGAVTLAPASMPRQEAHSFVSRRRQVPVRRRLNSRVNHPERSAETDVQ
ncbi:unnamed protein product, partial [Discosporangium mesarthrocarpum]